MSNHLFKRLGRTFASWPALALAVVALFVAAPLVAQQTGQVVGRVINGQSGEPMSDVQISIPGTGLGQVTNAQGRFLILNVPVGEQNVVAQLIGYGEARETVTVSAGQAATVDFNLYPTAVELEGMVVTGTAIAANKREVGNSIDLITSDEITAAGAMNFEDLLRGRALGVSVTGTPGSAGAGSDIVLRGTNSVNGRNTPLIYIDGVRMPSGSLEDAATEAEEHATVLGSIRPEDIERIEIIKGAAASTLYGTEASAGVIQIFTKKGTPGAPRWTFSTEQGFARVGHVGPDLDPTGLHVNDCTQTLTYDLASDEYSLEPVTQPGACPESGSWLRNAYQQDYNLSARGGSEDVTYFASTGFTRNEGVVSPQRAEQVTVRGNFTFNGFETLQLSLNSWYSRREIQWIPNGDNADGLLFNVARGEEGETENNNDLAVLDMDLDQTINHFNIAANANWTPTDNLRHRFTLGVDFSNSHNITFRPWLFWRFQEGARTVDIEDRRVITADYAGSWFQDLPSNFTSTLSFGGNYVQNEHLGNRTDVEGFVGPGVRLLENAEDVTNVNEDRDATEGGGLFLQEMIGWNNRLFITGGFRADTHSSFGDNYTSNTRFTIYPKLQATYTVSDHDFWPDWWETFRLRTAYGESGEAPPADGSVTTFQAASLADENNLGYIVLNLANEDIGPERSAEYEVGFDGSLFNGRVGLNATLYRRNTTDGLIFLAPPPSGGIAENIPQNVGRWKSEGIETGLDLLLFEGRGTRVSMTANYQYNRTEMQDLGSPQFESFDFNYLNSYRAGRVFPALYGFKLLNPDAVCGPAGSATADACEPVYTDDDTAFYGPTRPPHEIALGATFTVFERLTFDAFGIGQYGHVLYDDLAQELAVDGLWPECWPVNERYAAGNLEGLTAREIARCSEDFSDNEDWIEDADYFRLQTASVSYRVPEEWLPSALTAATIQLRGTNLFTITDFSGLYPDSLIRPAEQTARGAGYILPPAKTYTLNIRVNF